MDRNLIFDIGMHNGDDTAGYLAAGYRVVAVEANPELVAAAQGRFAADVSAGRLRIVNVAICSEPGPVTLFVNRIRSEHSSIARDMACRFHNDLEAVQVQGTRLKPLLDAEGVPFYMKIDIEGADSVCLQDLSASDLPMYVSAEAHSLEPLMEMYRLGYREFKCLNQLMHNTPQSAFRTDSETRMVLQEAAHFLKRDALQLIRRFPGYASLRSRLKRRQRPQGPGNVRRTGPGPALAGGQYAAGSSGPFGEQTPGDWSSLNCVAYEWLHLELGHPQRSRLPARGWFDFHARAPSVDVKAAANDDQAEAERCT